MCTTNDGLDAVLEQTPPSRRRDLVFVQNGLLLPWLRRNGLQHNTQVLLYMAGAASSRRCHFWEGRAPWQDALVEAYRHSSDGRAVTN